MTDAMKSRSGGNSKNDELLLLHMVERFNLILLALLIAGSWYFMDWPFARSVLVGGALSGGSFFWMKRTECDSLTMPQPREMLRKSTASPSRQVLL